MFGLFKKRNEIVIKDLVWKTNYYKYQSLIKQIQQLDKVIVLYYFEDTKKEIENTLTEASINYSDISSSEEKIWIVKAPNLLNKQSIDNRTILFAEHHPSFVIEKEITDFIAEKLHLKQAIFYISLEDELLKQFGAERIVEMLEKMGFKDDEVIEHQLISSSIQKAQKKIDEQVTMPSNTNKRKDWYAINMVK